MDLRPPEQSGWRVKIVCFLEHNSLAKLIPFKGYLIRLIFPSPLIRQELASESKPSDIHIFERDLYAETLSNWIKRAAQSDNPREQKVLYIQAFQREEQTKKLGTHYRNFLKGDPGSVLLLYKGVDEKNRPYLIPLLNQAAESDFPPAFILLIDHYEQLQEDLRNKYSGTDFETWDQMDRQKYQEASEKINEYIDGAFKNNNNLKSHYQEVSAGEPATKNCLPLAQYFLESDPETAFSYLNRVLNKTTYQQDDVKQVFKAIYQKASPHLRQVMNAGKKTLKNH